jgi:hypothetical protein
MMTKNGTGPHDLAPAVDEIQLAHDLLALVLSGKAEEAEFSVELDERTQIEMVASHNVLCWILGHDNQAFANNIKTLEQALEEEGIEITYDVDDNELLA